jgi:tetratricopeptide (TPR) repeat protein
MQMATGHDRWNTAAALVVFAVVMVCYLITISPTVSFWDSGEFIATSYSLGVPHPPGTPFYVVLGRIFAMLPLVQPALGVNLMSAISGAVATLFLYLITVRLLTLWRGVPRTLRDRVVIYSAGASAAFAGAFSGSFWINSIEAEVYSPSAFIIAFTLWLMIRWADRYRQEGSRNGLVLICYLLGLSVGLHLGTVLVFLPFVLYALLVDWKLFTDLRFIILTVFVVIIGLSNHLYLPIRSSLNPAIDEANPEHWEAFRDALLRKQYKPMTPFVRQAPWSFQFGMFWRYFWEQWSGPGGSWTSLLMLAGGVGAFVHFLREKRTFVLIGSLFLITSLGLIIYMNFTDHEVRERDYFFSHGFFIFCIWVGVAFTFIVDRLANAERPAWLSHVLSVGLLAFAFSSFYVNFESHDRRGDYNAHDYAYNMLATIDRNGIVFTNGDNDTFPLWYMQEVKGFRKDVRVVNLSLLNTPWYIWQLKHLEPRVPMTFSDEDILRLRPYRNSEGKIVMVKDIAAKDIVEAAGDGRPVYWAVTVADYMGYQPRLRLEGLAFRLLPEPTDDLGDLEKTLTNLYHVYKYRGLIKPAGEGAVTEAPILEDRPEPVSLSDVDVEREFVYDTDVYKDVNTRRLVTNYAAAHLRLCIYFIEQRRFEEAIRELERAALIAPDYEGYRDVAVAAYGFAGYVDKAESLANEFIAREPHKVNTYMQMFNVYRKHNRPEGSERILRRLVNTLPDNPDGYSLLSAFYQERGEYANAAEVIRRWVTLHPRDSSARELLRTLEQKAQEGD